MSQSFRSIVRPLGPAAWLVAALLPVFAACGCSVVSHGKNAEGVRFFQQGYYDGASQRFREAIQNDPRNADGYYNLAAVYHRTGKLNKSQPDFEQAENYYNQCLEHDGEHQECHRGLAVLLVEQGRADAATRLLTNWSSRSPANPAARIELARLNEEQGNRQAAMEHLYEALALDARNPRALAALGKLREDAGEYAEALSAYQRSLWHDRFQPEVAARVAKLQAAVRPAPLTDPAGASTAPRTVRRDQPPLR